MPLTIKLKYNEQANHRMTAAFIRGGEAGLWLHTIDGWGISPVGLTCFILSQNNRPTDAAGFLVVFNPGQVPQLSQVQHPYTSIGNKLFIPLDAELTPPVSEEELPSLLIWEYQVFHPSYGFIGFEKDDRIALADLLQLDKPIKEDWSYAHPGQTGWMPLQQIELEPVAPEDIFESVKEAVNSKSIEDLQKDDGLSEVLKILNPLGIAGLKGGLAVTRALMDALRGSGTGSGSTGNSEPGMMRRLNEWMQQKLDDLEKQRDKELKRLSDLFDKDMDEALKYALPLDSKYFQRGSPDNPSNRLGKRPVNFDLSKLGGGAATDAWDLDKYYDELREKYLAAARKAIEANDHKKAAYIYAHLLADYQSAAITLKEGKHYREAAVLYKDHLNNIPDAAACLEEGGLILEAIDQYKSIDRQEKAGDLYVLIGQTAQATQCYEQCVDKAAAMEDYLEIARLTADKLNSKDRAKEALIKGWNDVKQPEACLVKYFNILASEQQPLHQQIDQFYKKEAPGPKSISFLNVLHKVHQQHPSPELQDTCRIISYELISEQVEQGDVASLHMLKNFVHGDRLLASDSNRYIQNNSNSMQRNEPFRELQLMTQPNWMFPKVWRNELLLIGTTHNAVSIARISATGHVEYYPWQVFDARPNIHFRMYNEKSAEQIIVLPDAGFDIEPKTLFANSHFNNIIRFENPSWLPKNLVAMCFQNDMVVTVHTEHSGSFLQYFTRNGTMEKSLRIIIDGNSGDALSVSVDTFVKELLYYEGHFYFVYRKMLAKISETGTMTLTVPRPAGLDAIDVELFKDNYLQLVIKTLSGCVMGYMEGGELVMQNDFFAADNKNILSMKFISEKRLVIKSAKKLFIYNITKGEPVLLWEEIVLPGTISTVFPGFTRNQLGILHLVGKITMHEMKPL